ncbi:MAG: hypothetical protein R3E79_11280 [Caldilineaceae bacterium]
MRHSKPAQALVQQAKITAERRFARVILVPHTGRNAPLQIGQPLHSVAGQFESGRQQPQQHTHAGPTLVQFQGILQHR